MCVIFWFTWLPKVSIWRYKCPLLHNLIARTPVTTCTLPSVSYTYPLWCKPISNKSSDKTHESAFALELEKSSCLHFSCYNIPFAQREFPENYLQVHLDWMHVNRLKYRKFSVKPGYITFFRCLSAITEFRVLKLGRNRRSQCLRALRPLGCWDCGFESHRRHGCLSVVSVVWCPVEVSATGCSSGVLPTVVWLSVVVKPR